MARRRSMKLKMPSRRTMGKVFNYMDEVGDIFTNNIRTFIICKET